MPLQHFLPFDVIPLYVTSNVLLGSILPHGPNRNIQARAKCHPRYRASRHGNRRESLLNRESSSLYETCYYQQGFLVLLTVTSLDVMYYNFASANKTKALIKMETFPYVLAW